jgi:hypothetical protein
VKYIQLSTVPLRVKWLMKSLNDTNHQAPTKLQHTDSLCLRSISFFIAGLEVLLQQWVLGTERAGPRLDSNTDMGQHNSTTVTSVHRTG